MAHWEEWIAPLERLLVYLLVQANANPYNTSVPSLYSVADFGQNAISEEVKGMAHSITHSKKYQRAGSIRQGRVIGIIPLVPAMLANLSPASVAGT